MPPFRSSARSSGQPRTPYKKNNFVPANETLDGETNEEYRTRAESDPYTHYILKTGKHRGKTIKQVHESDCDKSYLNWMLTNPKACKDLNEDHIVRRAVVHWDSEAKNTAPAVAPSQASPASNGPAADSAIPESAATRFRDSRGMDIWITGMDIIGLFHMKESQLTRAGVRKLRSFVRFGPKEYRKNLYSLQQVYNAAVRTPNCPKDETPDQALERYLEKVRKCGRGDMLSLPFFCECRDCDDIRCGPTRGGTEFWLLMQREQLAEMKRLQEREDERWYGIEPWMGDDY
ncbi:hypothetical protein CFE70_010513 [Pyrenophora teres f. teres 0-1]|uniref:Uncharacterized protein n=2 Tax=Pyrenophora teres f. teres TaxID=97479 RepID=E3RJF6_PYRTT|nr:hypothetical protein PTT_08279 [Pyrenophora teres f. teres 0-1]KAE8829250.1 hypothetical protein PTNB85_08438 [Pyrenophora teres f. teres]CAA9964437.1 hypothetical protein PTMSG1_07796 [Pyrenophora teres f. maculata]KAE8830412.1 hypothetical protein HRS9139_07036 [Pyrenophora teres f. teres]KAE8841252.1 hypothetical protein HRS9122_05378 [Pyrenophora teres f. teres]